ncbi:hypothetical protein HWV62_40667 [Athelia sp. TMB]|nr:hypothetical protein HWV62_40667 [Athelia sp. TMB]
MERVQFQQEQMLAELKDLVQKGLFTAVETKQIMKKRIAFETALVRRIAKKSDFVRYAAYEMGLEQLRRKRLERLQLPPAPPSVSDYALVRRQFHIFERALKKFKSDVGLWVQYVTVAKREGARTLVGRITARALQLHPNVPSLYILAASHELSHLSPSAARTLLQRGIRLNADSVEMWREYVKMELGFIEGLRRRWDVLGIQISPDEKGKEKALEMPLELGADEAAAVADQMPTHNIADMVLDEGDATRKAIMDGAIVKSVISSAAAALARIELFDALYGLITTYPSPPSLRESLLDHLLTQLRSVLPNDPLAVKLSVARCLRPDAEGEELVEALKLANETHLAAIRVKRNNVESFRRLYADFVEDWFCRSGIDDHLQLYLISSLKSLLKAEHDSPALCSAHIRLLLSPTHPGSPPAANILKLARKYTSDVPTSHEVWLARLHAEERLASRKEAEWAWSAARASVVGTPEDVQSVWMWGLPLYASDGFESRREIHEVLQQLLRESMRDSSRSDVHEMLLISYATLHVEIDSSKSGDCMRKIGTAYLPTARVWASVFSSEAARGDVADDRLLRDIFDFWRKKAGLEATIAWGRWLLKNGRGKEASRLVVGARAYLDEAACLDLEKQWTAALDHVDDGELDL